MGKFFSTSIRTRLIAGVMIVSLLVVLVGMIALIQQQQLADQAAVTEATNVASLLRQTITSSALAGNNPGGGTIFANADRLRAYVNDLHTTANRDFEIVDAHKLILADVVAEDIGKTLTADTNNEVGQTLKDGQPRTYVETGPEYPQGIKQLVIPINNPQGQIDGALILEYTPLYTEMLSAVRATSVLIVVAGVLCVLMALTLGYATAASISRPLDQLTSAANSVRQGDWNFTVDTSRQDELGKVAEAFRQMSAALQVRETDLKDAIKEAQEANRLKDMFLATMSHELRTPLNAILTFNQLLGMGTFGPVNDEQRDYLEKSLSSGRHLLALINDVLDITKIHSGMMKLFIEDDFDVSQETIEVAATTEKLLEGRPVRLVTDIDQNLPHLTCDKRRVRQILLNLVSNAVKFTEQGSITLSAKQNNGCILFSVIDTGPGIRPEEQAIIFQPFIQTETGIRHGGGTGLGLPITQSLVRAHGGELRLESKPGCGAAFYVSLPMRAQLALGEQEIK